VTGRIPNSNPPLEPTATDGPGPRRRPVSSLPLATQPDGAQVSELSRAVATALESNDQKVDALRRKVASGAYVVDSVKVVKKMLQTHNSE